MEDILSLIVRYGLLKIASVRAMYAAVRELFANHQQR